MKSLLLLLTTLVLASPLFSQSNPEEILTPFFKEYAKNPAKAVEDIYATNPWTARIRDGIEAMKNEVNKYTPEYVGKYYGYDLITKKQLTDCFLLYSYIIKYDRQPMRFIFKLYKPNDKWMLLSFKIDSELDDEMEQAAKVYNLNFER